MVQEGRCHVRRGSTSKPCERKRRVRQAFHVLVGPDYHWLRPVDPYEYPGLN